MRTSFIVLLMAAAPAVPSQLPVPARAAGVTPRALRFPVAAAAGTEAGLVAITSRGVVILDPSGRVHRTLWPARALSRAGQPLPGRSVRPPWPGLTADGDFTGAAHDADDIDDGDDPRLADDGSTTAAWDIDEGSAGARAPAAGMDASPLRPLVTAAGDSGWVLREDGVWKVGLRDGAATRVYACDGRRVRALAAGGARMDAPTVALIDGDQLLRTKENDGQAFERIAGPLPPVRRLAVQGADSVVVLGTDGGLRAYGGPGRDETILFRAGVDDVAACAGDMLVLRDDQLFAFGAGGARRLGGAPAGTQALACGGASGGWAAFGAALHVSADGGRTWTARPSFAFRPVLALIPARTALWLVVRQGLWPLPPVGAAEPSSTEPRTPVLAPAGPQVAPERGRRPSDFWRRWAALLPEVDLDLEIGHVGPVREVRGLLAASFRVDGLWSGLVRAQARGARGWDVRPDVGATTELDALAVDARDPIAAAERRALARILEEPSP